MRVYRTFNELRNFLELQKKNRVSIGFVPTMGALHKGHLSLIQQSQIQCGITICSIFVNPSQFNVSEDLEKYPRPIDSDIEKLEKAGCDVVFLPSVEEVYPPDYKSVKVGLGGLENIMEGAHRPGHFDGVVMVVGRFFEQINPTKAFFGEKDFQQLAVIKRMVAVQRFSIEIVACPILREKSGLAMSSRNIRLSNKGLTQATLIFEQLNWAKSVFDQMKVSRIEEKVKAVFALHTEFDLEYFEIAEENDLLPISNNKSRARAFFAGNIEGVRLIDNINLN